MYINICNACNAYTCLRIPYSTNQPSPIQRTRTSRQSGYPLLDLSLANQTQHPRNQRKQEKKKLAKNARNAQGPPIQSKPTPNQTTHPIPHPQSLLKIQKLKHLKSSPPPQSPSPPTPTLHSPQSSSSPKPISPPRPHHAPSHTPHCPPHSPSSNVRLSNRPVPFPV